MEEECTPKKQWEIILEILKEEWPEWTPSWKLLKRETKWGWLGDEGKKRCRELEISGIIEKTKDKDVKETENGKYVAYRFISSGVKIPTPFKEKQSSLIL